MTGRPPLRRSYKVVMATRLVRYHGVTVTEAAARYGVALSSIRRALRAAGVEPLKGGRPKEKKT